jgi:hypothetical protein
MKALVKSGVFLLLISFFPGNVLAQIKITPYDIKKGDLTVVDWKLEDFDLVKDKLSSNERKFETSLIKSDLLVQLQAMIAGLNQEQKDLKYLNYQFHSYLDRKEITDKLLATEDKD